MASLRRAALATIVLAGCGDLSGFGGVVPPLTTIHVETTGTTTEPAAHLQVALVWGAQFLIEPLCILPPESPEVAAVLAQGCRDPFGFYPDRVGANVAIELGAAVDLPLFELPATDVMVGDVTARVAYASNAVYDDRNANGTLDLTRSRRPETGGDGGGPDTPPASEDVVYGASFLSMTKPDQRVAFREGAFNAAAAFYPRAGCGAPPAGYSVIAAGGFTASDAIAASIRGELPLEDPTTCTEALPAAAPITVSLVPPQEAREIACTDRRTDSSLRYREPPTEAPDLTLRTVACAKIPDFGTGYGAGIIQLIVSSRTDDRCPGLTHFVLRGCDNDPTCAVPEWDHSGAPPTWWPCPVQTAQ
jgi:hypothetical protein